MDVEPSPDPLLLLTGGATLRLSPGRTFVARVVRSGGGRATMSLAGAEIEVRAEAPLAPGSTVRLEVASTDAGTLTLRLLPPG